TLDRLLQLPVLDPGGNLFIRHHDLSADLTKKSVNNLDIAGLDRLHRFLRLQRATKLDDWVLDALISAPAIGAGATDGPFLVKLHQLSTVAVLPGLSLAELAAFFGPFPHQVRTGITEQQTYQRVFENPQASGIKEPGLAAARIGSGTLTPLRLQIAAILG